MFNKTTICHLKATDVEILDNELVKTASFILPSDIKYDPDFVYMIVRAVSSGEYYGDNKNGDFFPEKELKNNYTTFLTAHVFKNHENKDVKNAIGDVLRSKYDDKMKQVELLIRVDKRIAPAVARGIEKGYMTDVSMGCRVDYSICSICGNKAKTQSQYCEHIKYMRRKILEDGRKVYEININPKFHDISIVLNGAEKVAKIVNVYDGQEKRAGHDTSEMFEKVASYGGVPEKKYDHSDLINSSREILASVNDVDVKSPEHMKKIAEIQKEIKSQLFDTAMTEIGENRLEKTMKVRSILRALDTKYLSPQQIQSICSQIRDIAKSNYASLEQTFEQFTKVLDFAGIELSPREFAEFEKNLFGVDTCCDCTPLDADYCCEESQVSDAVSGDLLRGMETKSLGNAISAINAIVRNREARNILNDTPEIEAIPRIKAVIIKHKDSNMADNALMQNQIMSNIVKPMLPIRSLHPKFVVTRLKMIKPINGPVHNEFSIMVRPKSIGDIMSNLLYSIYQGNRMERLASGETYNGMQKFASYISSQKTDMGDSLAVMNKTAAWNSNKKSNQNAYNTFSAVTYGYPIINTYSKFQNARMANGKRLSDFNMYMAQYPEDAYQIQSLFGPTVYAFAKNQVLSIGSGLSKGIDGLFNGSYSKNAPTFTKRATEHGTTVTFSKRQRKILDTAAALMYEKRDDLADKILKKNKLSKKDLEFYLQNAKKCITMNINKEISKTASVIKNQNLINLPSEIPSFITDTAYVDFVADAVLNNNGF